VSVETVNKGSKASWRPSVAAPHIDWIAGVGPLRIWLSLHFKFAHRDLTCSYRLEITISQIIMRVGLRHAIDASADC